MREYYLGLLSIYILATINTCFAQVVKGNGDKPNIIFIISDDHAYQAISAYGSKIAKTPNIDRLAKEGAIFQNSFVTNSLCGPSRATLLTGKYSHLNGYKANEERFNGNQTLFSTLLQQNQYQTAWIGKWHLGTLPKGFDYFNILTQQGHYFDPVFVNTANDTLDHKGYVTDVITKFSLEWIEQRDKSKPFCMVIGEKATHRGWMPAVEDLGAYDKADLPVPATFYDDYKGRSAAQNQEMEIGKAMRLSEDLKINNDFKGPAFRRLDESEKKAYEAYYGKISKEFNDKKLSGDALTLWKYQRFMKDYLSTANSLDRNIGSILNYLDKTGLSKNTVVIYVSDQGFYLGEHGWFDKRFMYEESLRTPFVMRYPGMIKPGTSVSQFAVNIDWAPTILSIAGVKPPADMQGVSLLPLFKNSKADVTWKDQVYYHYYEYPKPHQVSPHFGVRTKTHKLICFYGEKTNWELYDLKKDPHEIKNLYGEPGYEKIIKHLKEKLNQLVKQYQDDEAYQVLQK
jgi:arylsulfatase A-like enzyme